jgi:hypothetical protein
VVLAESLSGIQTTTLGGGEAATGKGAKGRMDEGVEWTKDGRAEGSKEEQEGMICFGTHAQVI